MIVLKNVLVAIDFDEASDAALAYARTLARTFGARLHVLHVMGNPFLRPTANDPRDIESGIARTMADRLTDEERHTLRAVSVLRKSETPADEVVKYAEDEAIDLIVIGTHGRSGVAHLLMGSVAEKVVRSAPCPVLTVRHRAVQAVVGTAIAEPAGA